MIINNRLSLKLMVNNSSKIAFATFMIFWLSACGISPSSTVKTQTPVTTGDVINSNPKLTTTVDPLAYQGCVYPPAEIVQACIAYGGTITKVGRQQCHQCIVTYKDAGKACQDSTNCQGTCERQGEFIAAGTANQVGQCTIDSNPFGCRQLIKKGVAQSAICVD
ncbi:hypothetical protein [Psychrobacter sp. 16-MNA-CIBAN-0192]|uniref:hypothetical protein n=1 Tax=Psychrobacter sp. 16-MNA-CIBAN-0192 TaxID=3140448 RepID=UPI00332D647D